MVGEDHENVICRSVLFGDCSLQTLAWDQRATAWTFCVLVLSTCARVLVI